MLVHLTVMNMKSSLVMTNLYWRKQNYDVA